MGGNDTNICYHILVFIAMFGWYIVDIIVACLVMRFQLTKEASPVADELSCSWCCVKYLLWRRGQVKKKLVKS